MMSLCRRSLLQACLLTSGLVALGCQTEPPSAENAADLDRLTVSTRSLWARRLADSAIPALSRLHELDDLDFTAGCGVEDA